MILIWWMVYIYQRYISFGSLKKKMFNFLIIFFLILRCAKHWKIFYITFSCTLPNTVKWKYFPANILYVKYFTSKQTERKTSSTYLKCSELEWRCILEESIFEPPLRFEWSCIRALVVFHSTYWVGNASYHASCFYFGFTQQDIIF